MCNGTQVVRPQLRTASAAWRPVEHRVEHDGRVRRYVAGGNDEVGDAQHANEHVQRLAEVTWEEARKHNGAVLHRAQKADRPEQRALESLAPVGGWPARQHAHVHQPVGVR